MTVKWIRLRRKYGKIINTLLTNILKKLRKKISFIGQKLAQIEKITQPRQYQGSKTYY